MTWLLLCACLFCAFCLLRIISTERAVRLAAIEQRARLLQAAIEAKARADREIPSVG